MCFVRMMVRNNYILCGDGTRIPVSVSAGLTINYSGEFYSIGDGKYTLQAKDLGLNSDAIIVITELPETQEQTKEREEWLRGYQFAAAQYEKFKVGVMSRRRAGLLFARKLKCSKTFWRGMAAFLSTNCYHVKGWWSDWVVFIY